MLLDSLKQQTRAQHDRLEQLNEMPADRAAYLHLLESFYGYVAAWEAELARHVAPDDPLRLDREKTAWLQADLAHFGYSAAHLAALPRCTDLPILTSRAEMLGACYVLEGSTLGGQFIARHLRAALGLEADGTAYFRSYGADIGAKWQAFRAELLRHSSPENDPAIVRAAQETFDKLARWFGSRRLVTA